jgi:hypothetical protein
MQYPVALLFRRPRTPNGIVENDYGHGSIVDPKHIDDSASRNFHSLARIGSLMLLLISVFMGAASRAEPDSSKPPTFVFVCLHGSVKSQIAAAHFNRIASERGLSVIAISRGIAVDSKIPAAIREGLARDGLAPATDVPVGLTSEQAAGSAFESLRARAPRRSQPCQPLNLEPSKESGGRFSLCGPTRTACSALF